MNSQSSTILVTGAAGFIGAATCIKLLSNNQKVIGIDNLNSYYSQSLKLARIDNINIFSRNQKRNWKFFKGSIDNSQFINEIFEEYKPNIVINLAAQAGVRYSLKRPNEYIKSNIVGFSVLLEACRNFSIKNLIYASSSSVYGGNKSLPYTEKQNVSHPVSLYAATKISNELMAHSYSHLFGIPSIGLRFFTVYGPWGRPDMAPMIFAKAILEKKKISVFNNGNMKRDFTYIDDVVEAIWRCCLNPATVNNKIKTNDDEPNSSRIAPFRVFNVGNSNPINLLNFIYALEKELGFKADMEFKPIQPGDVQETHSDTKSLEEWTGYKPLISLEYGINKFAEWYLEFYKK